MKVYVLERGSYEDRSVTGVFSTLEKAIAAFPDYGWVKRGELNDWDNDATDNDATASIAELELDEAYK